MRSPLLSALFLLPAGLLCARSPAQEVTKPATSKPTPQELEQEKVGEVVTPEQRLAELQKELDKLKAELAYLAKIKERGGMVGRVKGYMTDRALAPHSVDISTPAPTPGVPKRTGARLLGDEEKARLADDVIFTVDGFAVTQGELDGLFDYYRSYQQDLADEQLRRQAVTALVVNAAVAAAFPNSRSKARQKIGEIRDKLSHGEDFATLATEMSECESATKGGDLELIDRYTMTPLFTKTAFGMKVGDLSPIVRSASGFHIIKVTGVEKGASPAQDRVRVSHILIGYDRDLQKLREVMQKAVGGDVDLAFVSDTYRQFKPENY